MDHCIRSLLLGILGSVIVAASLGVSAQPTGILPSNQDDFLPVEEAYQVQLAFQDEQTLNVLWTIAPGYYLYQHQFKFSPNQPENAPLFTAQYGQAIEKTDEYFGDVAVYYNYAEVIVSASQPIADQQIITLTSQGCADAGLCYPPRKDYFQLVPSTLTALPISAAEARLLPADTTTIPPAPPSSWLLMILFAFAGGLILNLMPCVFPILSLKVLSFASGDTKQNHQHGLYYAAGVIVSFVAIAALLLALKSAGQAVGWGFQLQSPTFVGFLALLFFAMGLSLSGVTELGTSFMGLGSSLTEGNHNKSSFFTGVLAVIVASPCTAPFMGTALGFALTQPAAVSLSVFAALGAGMAAPMVALSYSQRFRDIMPAPGAWMLTLRQILAFPLYLTVIWLLWIVGRQIGVDAVAGLLVACVTLALGLWLWNKRGIGRIVAVASLLLTAALSWQTLQAEPPANRASETFSRQSLATLTAQSQPVFVDVTADWCITCIANEKAVLETQTIQSAFAARNVQYVVVDWTNYDPAIAGFLAEFNRNGIPFYLLYPGDDRAPTILPQILTHDIVLSALEKL